MIMDGDMCDPEPDRDRKLVRAAFNLSADRVALLGTLIDKKAREIENSGDASLANYLRLSLPAIDALAGRMRETDPSRVIEEVDNT